MVRPPSRIPPVAVVAPSVRRAAAFLAMVEDFDANDPVNGEIYQPAKRDFRAYVRDLLAEERGGHLPELVVPCTHRWLVNEAGKIVGTIRLHHGIDTPFLASDAGHVGYQVAPQHRGKGYGHAALRAALKEARALGLDSLLLVANEDNARSRAIIERHGGRLAETVYSEFWERRVCRYWVSTQDVGGEDARASGLLRRERWAMLVEQWRSRGGRC